MLHTLQQTLAPAVAERLTLLINHVLAAEAAATERLRPHAGRSVQLELVGWPRLLPPTPPLVWSVTPAGLFEWLGPDPAVVADLRVAIPAHNPALLAARLIAGESPPAEVSGDPQLAGDADWLIANLRWDLAADLERLFPAPVAQGLQVLGTSLARGLRAAVHGVDSLRERWQGRPGS